MASVSGNKSIVSASPNVLVFTFDETTRSPERKSSSARPASLSSHTAHSFVFGPDGRLYWNFGNEGHSVHDKTASPSSISPATPPTIPANRPPGHGLPLRARWLQLSRPCLGNFRNNYEVCVDSFGTMCSRQRDDGNFGVRINYVMEYGNFGYVR